MPRILTFAGSAREASLNKKLARLGSEKARAAGAEVTFIDLRDCPLPLFDQDFEAAEETPAAALSLKQLMIQHDGLLLACPEYNGSISPLLKNTLDCRDRPKESLLGPPTPVKSRPY